MKINDLIDELTHDGMLIVRRQRLGYKIAWFKHDRAVYDFPQAIGIGPSLADALDDCRNRSLLKLEIDQREVKDDPETDVQ